MRYTLLFCYMNILPTVKQLWSKHEVYTICMQNSSKGHNYWKNHRIKNASDMILKNPMKFRLNPTSSYCEFAWTRSMWCICRFHLNTITVGKLSKRNMQAIFAFTSDTKKSHEVSLKSSQ